MKFAITLVIFIALDHIYRKGVIILHEKGDTMTGIITGCLIMPAPLVVLCVGVHYLYEGIINGIH